MEQGAQNKPAVDGIAIIPTTGENFIRTWLEVMKPFHHLTSREMDFTAALLARREEIAADVKDQSNVDKLLFDEEEKEKVCKKVGITNSHMKMILHKMRKAGVINGKKIDPKYILKWQRGKPFRMVFVFKNQDDA